ncbi:16S rRNA (cytosine(1402)-N(4))-methyltransferase RsmH [Frisingicoccus sp.]|uniref:16S rRNA (cytosine(1402)-N(4))-methyltransferase RsmH n=1 Tax=Frisingicoccus sp. TaxID=1918627 RepID=UPI00306A095D
MDFKHQSVLLEETIENLNIVPDGIYVDGTLGGGGHAFQVCSRLSEKGHFIGIDQDAAAIQAAGDRLKPFEDKVTIVRSNYSDMKQVLKELGISTVNGIVLDLGVSSYQLDTAERGFSYRENAPLDMRMDQRQDKTARDIVNGYSEMELYRMIRDYGEDKFAKNIAKHIVRARQNGPVETTDELTEIIKAAIPMKFRAVGGHPAKRTFQAIRIELNQELEVLKGHLNEMIELLAPKGRICIITFHSLEDRIVKNIFRKCENPCECPPSFPTCVCGKKSLGKVITRKPILPSEEELEVNPRSKSAKLRVFERR